MRETFAEDHDEEDEGEDEEAEEDEDGEGENEEDENDPLTPQRRDSARSRQGVLTASDSFGHQQGAVKLLS